MRTSSADRQFVAWAPLAALLIVGVLLLASAAPLYAEPAAMQPVNWFAPVRSVASVPRSAFLLPTLAVPETGAAPRLMVTESAFRGAAPARLTLRAGQAPAEPSKSWWSRNWGWVVLPVVAVVVAGSLIASSWETQ